ncbi:hypothetical protein NPIL_271171 [Nephila pilipes]|uniref:p53 transactivation domain-containing protein n=1 Tax=Nephila pilipes TaxID=299642 RepID=A0A8X6MJE4_NEPPI|nr:hypothetical protein NPIL_271171 [Nephila pilipes]
MISSQESLPLSQETFEYIWKECVTANEFQSLVAISSFGNAMNNAMEYDIYLIKMLNIKNNADNAHSSLKMIFSSLVYNSFVEQLENPKHVHGKSGGYADHVMYSKSLLWSRVSKTHYPIWACIVIHEHFVLIYYILEKDKHVSGEVVVHCFDYFCSRFILMYPCFIYNN